MLAFWYHLVWGRQKLQVESENCGHTLEMFSAEGPPLTTAQKRRTAYWLQGFRGKRHTPFLNFQAEKKWARTVKCITDGGITVELYSGLLEPLRGQKKFSETQMLRVNFWVAILLLYELAHAVHKELSSSDYEPYYGDQVLAELGHAWTCWAFGGVIEGFHWEDPTCIGQFLITPPSTWTKVPPAPWIASLPTRPVPGDLPQKTTMWILATEYVQRVQMEELWEEDIRADGFKALHIFPTDGCDDSQLLSNANWTVKFDIRRGPNDRMKIEDYHLNPSRRRKKDN